MLQGRHLATSKPHVAGLMLAVLGLAGCSASNLPKTCPAKGRVVFKEKGLNPSLLAGGYVEFQSISNPGTNAFGEIQDDGTFVLGTFINDKGMGGALPGTYGARIAPPPGGWEGKARGAIAPRFASFDRSGLRYTVAEGSENDFTVLVERAGP